MRMVPRRWLWSENNGSSAQEFDVKDNHALKALHLLEHMGLGLSGALWSVWKHRGKPWTHLQWREVRICKLLCSNASTGGSWGVGDKGLHGKRGAKNKALGRALGSCLMGWGGPWIFRTVVSPTQFPLWLMLSLPRPFIHYPNLSFSPQMIPSYP